MSFFKINHQSKKSKTRLGTITTDHGVIQTPAFVPVATKGTLKSLTPDQLKSVGSQVAFVNTYHLVTHPGADIIAQAGGIHNFSKLSLPLMSDSGGFQVFSLAKGSRLRSNNNDTTEKRGAAFRGNEAVGKGAMPTDDAEALVEKISEDGVKFRSTYDGTLVEFTPETSMQFQKKIGADLIMAFDECTYYPATEEYARKAMERTHRWLERCINETGGLRSEVGGNATNPEPRTTNQYLYGIIQGGTFESLRKESAEFISKQPTDGVAIGGVSVGETKAEMREQVSWVKDYLPADKPVHLLGIGHADDIRDLVTSGIDTFDCVEPSRMARMGVLYQVGGLRSEVGDWEEIDINKTIYKNNLEKVDENCNCYVCENFTKAYIHHLFKQRELLGYTLATYHNLSVMEQFMASIRSQIANDQL